MIRRLRRSLAPTGSTAMDRRFRVSASTTGAGGTPILAQFR